MIDDSGPLAPIPRCGDCEAYATHAMLIVRGKTGGVLYACDAHASWPFISEYRLPYAPKPEDEGR